MSVKAISRYIVTACLLLLVAACDGDDKDEGFEVEQADLDRAVLTGADLPSGWGLSLPESLTQSDGSDATCGIDLGHWGTPSASVDAFFQRSQNGPYFYQLMNAYSEVEASRLWDSTVKAINQCPESRGAYDGVELNFRFSALGVTRVGDESVAVKGVLVGPETPVTAHLLLVRRSAVLAAFMHLTIGPPPDVKTTEDLVSRAVNKLDGTLNSASK
jgi:hypothetical protein